MSMHNLYCEKQNAIIDKYVAGTLTRFGAVERLENMGLDRDEAENHLDAAECGPDD